MADAITIIGAVGAIANIVDVITKSINTIKEIRRQWLEAELTLLSLASQLTALRAALNKIQEWMSADLIEAHHQLVMDLDVSMSCCKVLVNKMDTFISELGNTIDEPLDFRTTFKLVFGSRDLDSVQKLIERQTSALTLLLTACNSKTLSEQKAILEKSTTRRTLGRAKDDSASLLVLRDTNSISSKWTDTMSKLSIVFVFDQELFTTKVYSRVLRGSFKQVLRRQREPTISDMTEQEARLRSIAIDKQIQRDKERYSQDVECLLLGSDEVGKRAFMSILETESQQLRPHPESVRQTDNPRKFRFPCGECYANLLLPVVDSTNIPKIDSSSDKILMIIFVFDLLNWDQKMSADSSLTKLDEDLAYYRRVMESNKFRHCTPILILNNQASFGEGLHASAFAERFPNDDVENIEDALECIRSLFAYECSWSLYHCRGGLQSVNLYQDLQKRIEAGRFSAYRHLDQVFFETGSEPPRGEGGGVNDDVSRSPLQGAL